MPMTSPARLTFFFFNDTATTEIYTLSLHDALPISLRCGPSWAPTRRKYSMREICCESGGPGGTPWPRSERNTAEHQIQIKLVYLLLPQKKKELDGMGLHLLDALATVTDDRALWAFD